MIFIGFVLRNLSVCRYQHGLMPPYLADELQHVADIESL